MTDSGDRKKVEEAWNSGKIETVHNLTVADWHTYFVGDEGWGWAAWAHNAYKFEKKTAGQYNYSKGEYRQVIDKGTSGYSRIWWIPKEIKRLLSTEGVQNQVCLDNSTKLGDQLQASAQAIADGWTDKPQDKRYRAYYDTILTNLNSINSFLSDDQKLSLDGIDKNGKRPPILATPNSEYVKAVKRFWLQRSTAIGAYVHEALRDEYQNYAGLTYNPGKGPDFKYVKDDVTVYFEVLPETGSSLQKHSIRSMNEYLYRTVFYNRNNIKDGGDEQPDKS